MVLVLLLSLAVLLWFIQGQLDDFAAAEVPLPAGTCSSCQAETDVDWLVCPHCQSRLRESCDYCHKSKQISQAYCPYCGETGKKAA